MPSHERSRPMRGAASKSTAGGDRTKSTTALTFDPVTGWLDPWPYPNIPREDVAPFVGPDGRDAFDGRQLRDPDWWHRTHRRQARAALRYFDRLLADDTTDIREACRRAADVLDGFARGIPAEVGEDL